MEGMKPRLAMGCRRCWVLARIERSKCNLLPGEKLVRVKCHVLNESTFFLAGVEAIYKHHLIHLLI